jgi:hypothetical protein
MDLSFVYFIFTLTSFYLLQPVHTARNEFSFVTNFFREARRVIMYKYVHIANEVKFGKIVSSDRKRFR